MSRLDDVPPTDPRYEPPRLSYLAMLWRLIRRILGL